MAAIILRRHEANQGDLPPVCMVCGRKAVGYRFKRFRSRWPTIPLRAPLCREHWHHWHHRSRILLAGILVSAVVLLVGILLVLPPLTELLAMFGALIIVFGIIAIMATVGLYVALDVSIIRMTAADRHTITLAGLANGFVAAYAEHLAERRERTPAVSVAAPPPPDDERVQKPSASVLPATGTAAASLHYGDVETPLKYQLTEEDYLAYYLYFWERKRRLHGISFWFALPILLVLAPLGTGIVCGVIYFPIRGMFAVGAWPVEPGLYIAMTGVAIFAFVFMSVGLLRQKRTEKGIQEDRKTYRAWMNLRLLSYARKGLIYLGYDFEVRFSASGFVEVSELRNPAAEGVEVHSRIETRVNWSVVDEIIVTAEHLYVSVGRQGFLIVPRTAFVDVSAFLVYVNNVRSLHRAATKRQASRSPDLDLLPSVNERFSSERTPDWRPTCRRKTSGLVSKARVIMPPPRCRVFAGDFLGGER